MKSSYGIKAHRALSSLKWSDDEEEQEKFIQFDQNAMQQFLGDDQQILWADGQPQRGRGEKIHAFHPQCACVACQLKSKTPSKYTVGAVEPVKPGTLYSWQRWMS